MEIHTSEYYVAMQIFFIIKIHHWASLVAQGWRIHLQCRNRRRSGFDPWVEKIPRRRACNPLQLCLAGESHGQRTLAGYSL